MDQSRKLFFKRVFGSEDDCPQQFRGISLGIIKRCGGLPLAIISIASLLASQPVLLMEQWVYIHDSLLASNLKISTSEGMRQVLNLSYDNLPHYLKTCLLYLNTYPEDYTILKDDLVKQWVAEGFINAIEGQDVEEVAGSYFDELVNRRMIQPMDTNYKHEVFMVHGMLLDLIAYKSMEDNFSTAVDYSQNTIGLCHKVRRLSFHFGSAKYAKPPASVGLSQVRSLAFFGLFKSMPPITEFNLLRVLILQIWGDCGGTSVDLTRICELHQLRYLQIACDVSIEIPTLMQRLQCLETVEIYARLTTVPLDIVHLPRLLHLCLPGETNLLGSVGHMTSLRRLGYLDLSSNSFDTVHSLGKLTNLRNLHLACCTVPSDHLESNMQCLGSILGKLSNLKSLTLVSTSSRANILVPCHGLSFVSPVPCLLQRLELLPRICIFSSLPKWIGGLGELCTLKIAVRELPRNDVDTLKRLSTLNILSLCVKEAPLQRITFHSMEFPVLRYFKFRCREACLTFEEGAMPNLRRLKLGFNAHGAEQHSSMPTGLENLLSLEELTARIGHRGATESDRRAAESALTTMIGVHRRCPGVNIFWVDWIFYLNESISRRTQEEGSRILEEEHGILEIEPEQEYGIAQRDEKQKYYMDEEGDTRSPEVPSIEPTTWKLAFRNPPVLPIFTGSKIEDANGDALQIIIVDVDTDLPLAPPQPLRIELVPLFGDFPPEDRKEWSADEFTRGIVKERARKRPLLTGDVNLTMRDGCVTVNELQFTDNSSWFRCRKFRIGVRVAPGSYDGVRIREAMSEAFVVRDHRGELYRKHYPPLLGDHVWRLEKISKEGAFHRKLTHHNVRSVQEFLRMLMVKPDELRTILGDGMTDRMWEATTTHAKTCIPGDKVYVCSAEHGTIYVNSICQLVKIEFGGVECTLQQLNRTQRIYVQHLLLQAHEQQNNLLEADAVMLHGHATNNVPLLQNAAQVALPAPAETPLLFQNNQ